MSRAKNPLITKYGIFHGSGYGHASALRCEENKELVISPEPNWVRTSGVISLVV